MARLSPLAIAAIKFSSDLGWTCVLQRASEKSDSL
jgi:hypothetical protein